MPASVTKAGFQKGDVIVEIDGSSKRMTESELIGAMIKHRPGDKVKTTVLRGGQRVELAVTMQ